jgi:coproporphyrinogen III oxidase-like Fe-S oxidoreductase
MFADLRWKYGFRFVIYFLNRSIKKYLHLNPSSKTLQKAPDDKKRLLYIHIPFCLNLCPYCSFHKFKFHEQSAKNYFKLLEKEMEMVYDLGYKFDSIYFGGGTTTILPKELSNIIDRAKELFDIKEISCESDPAHLKDLELYELSKKIDRLSVGIQSFDDRYLKQIGRYKKFGSAIEQFDKVKKVLGKSKSVNIDIIFNYPNQTLEDMEKEINTILTIRPPQVTFYPLMYAPGIKKTLSKKWGDLDFEKEQELYNLIQRRMSKVYTRRSAWAWSLNSDEIIDEYVIEKSEYIGIGSGAFSFIDDTLYANTFSLPKYDELISDDKLAITHSVSFSKNSIKQYRMMIELFGLKPSKSHLYLERVFLRFIGAYDKDGNITQKGLYLFSSMMREFYNCMDYIRETMRNRLNKDDGFIKGK